MRLEPWTDRAFEPAARLIQLAYANHVDSEINDQYRTEAGAMKFLAQYYSASRAADSFCRRLLSWRGRYRASRPLGWCLLRQWRMASHTRRKFA